MAAPLPDPSAPTPRGAALRGLAVGAAGAVALVVGLWLALREPTSPPPAVASAPGPAAATPPSPAPAAPSQLATAPAAPAPVAPAPVAPVAPAPAVAAPAAAAPPPPAATAAAPPAAPPAPPPAPPAPPAAAAPPATPPPAAAPAPAAQASTPTPPPPQAPGFDIMRVSPSGGLVAAGRAEPGAFVILRANGREIGRVRADAQGQWAFAGGPALPPGAHEITLAALDPAGREIAGAGTIEAVVAAPAPPSPAPAAVAQAPAAPSPAPAAPAQAAPAAPIVVLTTPQGAPTLLQGPGRQAGAARLGLDIVDYDAGGEIRFAGTAPPGATIRLYVDDAHVGDATAGPDGRWSLAPTATVAQGEHRLRLDQLDGTGRVAARVEQPFQRAAVAALDAGVQRVVVQPRQNLWRIARRAYGQGVRYTEIYAANRDVISDPARIWPGQVFTIPGAQAAGGSTPASASRSR